MAIVILDSLEKIGSIYCFPPFVANVKDLLYEFNDDCFEINYLKNHPRGELAVITAESFLINTRPNNRICTIGGNLITKSEDYIFVDLITSDKEEKLHQFNFITIDKNNLGEWDKKTEFINLLCEFQNTEKWESVKGIDYINVLIDKLSGASELQMEYAYSDHLGNARVLYADLNKDGRVDGSEKW